jgi:hypothetical protein
MPTMNAFVLFFIAMAGFGILEQPAVQAQDFYKDKAVTIIVG